MITIDSVHIENFRIYKKADIKFEGKQLILFTGSNGYGKTTLIDSIEWCITGDIKRLHENYDLRNKGGEKDRIENKRGILKNKDSKKTDKVIVQLTLISNNKKFTISREREKDTLVCDENFTINGISEDDSLIINEIEILRKENSLYKYNFCDMNKTYHFMNLSRKDIKRQVRDFLHDRSEVEKLLIQLNGQVDSVKKIADNISSKLSTEEEKKKIKIEEKKKIVVSKDIKDYPLTQAYENEPIIINSLEQAKNVENIIRKWAYDYVFEVIKKLQQSKESFTRKSILTKIVNSYDENKELINKFIKYDLYKDEKRNCIYNTIIQLKSTKKLPIKGFDIKSSEYNDFLVLKKRFENDKKKYVDLLKEVDLLEKNIMNIGKGTNLIEAFSSLVKAKDEIIREYRDEGNKRCPLCGSTENFSVIDITSVAKDAQEYLDRQSEIKKQTIATKIDKEKKVNDLLNSFNEFSLQWVENKINILTKINKIQINEWNKVKEFFCLANNNNIKLCEEMYDNIDKEIKNLDEIILVEANKVLLKEIVFKILEYLKYPDISSLNSENYSPIISFISNLEKNDIKYNKYNYELMVNKLSYLESYETSEQIAKIDKEIKSIEKNIECYNEQNKKINDYRSKLKDFLDLIGEKIKTLDQKEFDDVGPYLFKIFSKIIKHTNIKGFNFKRDDSKRAVSGSAFLDDDENNILNMFSEGQLGVFMISYFIGNILKRRNENVLGTFFMDDMTSCLDDINILSFIDTIKYLISDEVSVMNQLFFATCNDNIKALFKNRMKGFGISYKIIEFSSLGQVKK
ncbi:hypothetical protein FDB28_11410 [Clostridium botulinum]|nr:hypothetical protein [Clostridium botulinum]